MMTKNVVNKKILKKFFQEAPSYNIDIVTAEYPPFFIGINFIYRLLGISFDVKKYKHTQCIMYYTSMIPNRFLSQLIRNGVIKLRKINPNLQLGLGTIATGVLGNEPIISVPSLKNDIDFMRVNNIETGIIFRLGGLNEDYIKLLNDNL